jgi:GPH family glycoside/pentoside/hexuronide:cation symporter
MLVLLKAGSAAALATISWTLGRLGYVPGAIQPPAVVLGMKLLAFGIPVLGSAIAILVLVRLDIGHTVHARVRRINGLRALRAQDSGIVSLAISTEPSSSKMGQRSPISTASLKSTASTIE